MNSPTDHASIGKPSSIIWHMDHKMTQNLYRFVEWIQLYKVPSKPQRRTYSLAVVLTLHTTSRSPAAAALSCFIHESLWPETDYTHFCLYHWVNSPLPPHPYAFVEHLAEECRYLPGVGNFPELLKLMRKFLSRSLEPKNGNSLLHLYKLTSSWI